MQYTVIKWLKNTCYPLYLICCGMWNPVQFQIEVNDIREAARLAKKIKHEKALDEVVFNAMKPKKPRIRFRPRLDGSGSDEIFRIDIRRMEQKGYNPHTGRPIYVRSLAP